MAGEPVDTHVKVWFSSLYIRSVMVGDTASDDKGHVCDVTLLRTIHDTLLCATCCVHILNVWVPTILHETESHCTVYHTHTFASCTQQRCIVYYGLKKERTMQYIHYAAAMSHH